MVSKQFYYNEIIVLPLLLLELSIQLFILLTKIHIRFQTVLLQQNLKALFSYVSDYPVLLNFFILEEQVSMIIRRGARGESKSKKSLDFKQILLILNLAFLVLMFILSHTLVSFYLLIMLFGRDSKSIEAANNLHIEKLLLNSRGNLAYLWTSTSAYLLIGDVKWV